MAAAIGVASGLLTLTTFALQSSVALYETIKSFKAHANRVRDLLEELEALIGVLGPLADMVETTTDNDLSNLELPLKRCGSACKEFEHELLKCLSSSGGNRTSFRGWARLRYMSDDIDGFRRLLAGYKLTINIALTDLNLRKSSVTAEILENHKTLIETAKDDLETHLESIDEKLQDIIGRTVTESESDTTELRLMKEERLSTEKCLQICARLSEHIEQIQLATTQTESFAEFADIHTSSETITNEGLRECKDSLTHTATKLENHMRNLMDRMLARSRTNMTSQDDMTDLARLRDEWETARQCMDICSKADRHLKENITTIDNYGTGDAIQFMVSTNGKVIHGKNRGLGWRTRQIGGYISDTAVQAISRDMTSVHFRNAGNDSTAPQDDTESGANDKEYQSTTDYRERYGQGYKLTPKSSYDKPTPSTSSPEAGRRGSPQR